MNTKHENAAEHHAAKRHWLNSHEAGYHKAMGNRQVQMIAIGGAIGTGLFLGAGARLQMAGPALAWSIWSAASSPSLFFAPSANWSSTAPRAAASSLMPGSSSVKKAAYVAGWMYFVNWAMTGIVDITAVALYMHYWGAFGDVPQWVFALGALAIVGTMNMIGVKWFAEMEFWFALVKVLAIVAFLVVGTIFLGSGKPLDGNATGFHLITDNGGFFPHGLLPALVLVQGWSSPSPPSSWWGPRPESVRIRDNGAEGHQQRDLAYRSVLCRFGGVAGAASAVERLPCRTEPVRYLLLKAGRAIYRQRDEHRGVNRGPLQP